MVTKLKKSVALILAMIMTLTLAAVGMIRVVPVRFQRNRQQDQKFRQTLFSPMQKLTVTVVRIRCRQVTGIFWSCIFPGPDIWTAWHIG